ncbi:unnamed protein product [Cylicocyclus nassatus]|uniref:Amine oxidase n=1 Tax=Cylicocyclus nassatus TaxID=53992 RepID=A0AA36GQ35_CYLNA|nr:unnamed protein product [Cylicocyclus nassatus]
MLKQQLQIFDVVVVGAGLTGLNAVRELRRKIPQARVKVLEGRPEVGGRIRAKSMHTAEGNALVDTGSYFISPSANEVVDLANEIGLTLYTQSNCGLRSLNIRGYRRSRRQAGLLSTKHTFDDVLASPALLTLAKQNVHDYLANQHTTRAETDTANRLLQVLYDSPDVNSSVLHIMLASGSENGTLADMLSRYGHGQSLLMQGGLHRLTSALADWVDIGFNQTVTAIEESESHAIVKTKTTFYRARQVIVTIPPVLTTSIEFTPPLESDFAQFTKDYAPAGKAYYFTITYSSPFWRSNGKNGQIIYTNAQGPIVWLTAFDVGRPTLCAGTGSTGMLWGIAHFADEKPISQAQRNAAYVEVVTQTLGLGTHLPLDVSDEHYVSDQFARGAVGVLTPGVEAESLKYLQGVNTHGERVVFASAEYSNSSMGLMNGALLSGKLAASVVTSRLSNLTGREDITNRVNTNEIPTVVRLSDDAIERLPVSVPLRPSSHSPFVYRTSTHYPSITNEAVETTTYSHFSFNNNKSSANDSNFDEHNNSTSDPFEFESSTITEDEKSEETSAMTNDNVLQRNLGVESNSPTSKFVYQTSSQNPPTTMMDTTTITHFSFGNTVSPKPFIMPQIIPDPSITTIPPPTTTQRSTFTPIDPSRTTTPFVYQTSTLNPPMEPAVPSAFKHFSNGFQEGNDAEVKAVAVAQQDAIVNRAVNGDITKRLKDTAEEADSLSALALAKRLSSILVSLLDYVQNERR